MRLDTTLYNDIEKEMVSRGYKIYTDNMGNSYRLFQKCFIDDIGKKYYITAYHYNWIKQGLGYDTEDKDMYTFKTQYRIDEQGKDQCVDVTFSGELFDNTYRQLTTLDEVERFFEFMFISIQADYYELYYT